MLKTESAPQRETRARGRQETLRLLLPDILVDLKVCQGSEGQVE